MKQLFLNPFRRFRAFLAIFIFMIGAPMALAKTTSLSHNAWDDILSAYVSESADGVNRVNYAGLKANTADSAKLDAYIGQYADLDFSALSRDEQFAAWANLYNAVTVDYILGKYPTDTIKPWYSTGPWKDIKVKAGGRDISLNDIEHEVLRKQWADDPRLHYAINCASFSCPDLLNKAWDAATLDADLDAAARDYINDPRGVTVKKNGIEISSIYKWFSVDFGGTDTAVIAHILEYASPELAAQINANPKIKGYDYDWSLNEVQS